MIRQLWTNGLFQRLAFGCMGLVCIVIYTAYFSMPAWGQNNPEDQSQPPAQVNLLLNPTMEVSSGSQVANWKARQNTFQDTGIFHTGSASLKAIASPDPINYTYQSPSIQAGLTYTISGWIKTDSVQGYGVLLRFAQTAPSALVFDTNAIKGTHDWTFVAKTFIIPASYSAGRFDLQWAITSGTAWFDDVAFCQGTSCPTVSATPKPTATAIEFSPVAIPSFTYSQSVIPTSSSDTSSQDEQVNKLVAQATNVVRDVSHATTDIAKQNGAQAALPVAAASFAVPTLPAIIPTLPFISWWHLPTALFGLLRKKKNPWGVVFDSQTKQPLDPAVVTLTNNQGKRWQAITDLYGRYEFLIEPGQYTINVEKSNYSFPSTRISNPDPVYENIYTGQPFTVSADDLIAFNIPLDPVGKDWNQQEKQRMQVPSTTRRFTRLYKILTFVGYAGLAWSILMCFLAPTFINIAIAIIYCIFYTGLFIYRKQHPWGVVRNTHSQPASGMVVKLTSPDLPVNKQPPVVTSDNGRYSFLVVQGKYILRVESAEADGTYKQVAQSEIIDISQPYGHIHQDLLVN